MVCTILMPPFMRRFFFSTRTRSRPRRNTSPPRKRVRFFPKKKSCSTKPSRKQLQLRLRPVPPLPHHLHQRRCPDSLPRGLHGFFHEGGRESLRRFIERAVRCLKFPRITRAQSFPHFDNRLLNRFLFPRIDGITHLHESCLHCAKHFFRFQFRFRPDALAHVVER